MDFLTACWIYEILIHEPQFLPNQSVSKFGSLLHENPYRTLPAERGLLFCIMLLKLCGNYTYLMLQNLQTLKNRSGVLGRVRLPLLQICPMHSGFLNSNEVKTVCVLGISRRPVPDHRV